MLTTYQLPCINSIKEGYSKDVMFSTKNSKARNNYIQSYPITLSKYKEQYSLEFCKLYEKQCVSFMFPTSFLTGDTITFLFDALFTNTLQLTIIQNCSASELVNALYSYLVNGTVNAKVTFIATDLTYIQATFLINKSNDSVSILFSNKTAITQYLPIVSGNTVTRIVHNSVQELTNIFMKQDNNSNLSWLPIPENTLKYFRIPTNWEISKIQNIDNIFNSFRYNLTVTLETYY